MLAIESDAGVFKPQGFGFTGSDVSFDGARSWKAFDTAAYDAVDCVRGTCWASGPAGAVAVLAR